MATPETITKALALLTDTWPKEVSSLTHEIFNQVMADVDDADLIVATMQMLRSGREFPPTPGIIRETAKRVQNDRLQEERNEQEKQLRTEPASRTLQITHGQNSRLDEIPFTGDWEKYKDACEAQAKIEWEAKASWCPGFPNYDYSSLIGVRNDKKRSVENAR